MEADWGPWIDGSIAPPVGAYVQMIVVEEKGPGSITHECTILEIKGDFVVTSPPLLLWGGWELDRYRIRKPRAIRDLIELVENLPAPVSPEPVSA